MAHPHRGSVVSVQVVSVQVVSMQVVSMLVLALLSLAACTGDEAATRPPARVLAEAKRNLDETSGVHVLLATESLPPGVDGVVSADGVGTHPPAFEGELKVSSGGITADAAVVAVDGDVHAKLPFTTEFEEINPADYGAPDPADLLSTDMGLSSLLTDAENVEEGEQVRRGEAVLTEYTATVPGDAVARVIPSAASDSSFDATFTITEDDLLDEAVLTGPFYPDAADVTYSIAFDDYGTDQDITAP